MTAPILKSLGPALRRVGFINGPPAVLWVPALAIGLLLLLSPVYLAVRTLGAGQEFWEALLRWRVLELLLRTLVLVGAVTAASIVISLPLAWLTVRSDLPLARTWGVLVTLPLVDTQLRGRLCGSRSPRPPRNAARLPGGAGGIGATARHQRIPRGGPDFDFPQLPLRAADRPEPPCSVWIPTWKSLPGAWGTAGGQPSGG